MGYFRVFDDKKKEWVVFEDHVSGKESPLAFVNHMVNSGRQFAVDFMFNNTNWFSGSTFIGNRYVGVGRSTDTNAGVTGPTTGTSVPVGGSWDGPSDHDWRLSDEITGLTAKDRSNMECIRAGNTAHLYSRLTDDNVTYPTGTTTIDIYEIGIFLGSGQLLPESDPTDVSATHIERRDAMLVRAVSFYQQGTGYFARSVQKVQGNDLIIQYVVADFEG